MKPLFYLLILSFCQFLYAQKEVYIPIESLKGEPLIRIDSLSFDETYLGSEFYLDSVKEEPFTGKALKFYNVSRTSFDSLNLVSGVKHGWQKKYFNEKGQPALGWVHFYDQLKRIYLSAPISIEKKNYSAFARFYIDSAYYYFEIKYRKSGKIIVKQLISLGKDYRSENKLKFDSLKELEYYFINFEPIYIYCKQAGFFGKAEIE